MFEDEMQKKGLRALKYTIKSGLGRTLFWLFMAMALIPLTVVGYVGYKTSYNNLYDDAVNSLSAVTQLKKEYIKTYFSERLRDLELQTKLNSNKHILSLFKDSLRTANMPVNEFVKSQDWKKIKNEYCMDLKDFQITYGYSDLFFIDNDGNILFSVIANTDLGTNVFSGSHSNTRFGKACRKAFSTGKPVFSDFEFYEPASNKCVGFMVNIIVGENGEKLGLLASGISIDEINEIMMKKSGLGETGESYLVGMDLLMRSNSRFSNESSILKTTVDTHVTRQWLNSKLDSNSKNRNKESADGFVYNDYRGVKVLGAYNDLNVAGVDLALLVEIDEAEAFKPAITLRKLVFGLFCVTVITVIFISIIAVRYIVVPIKKLSDWANRVAKGDLSYSEKITSSKNEIGQMSESFLEVVNSFLQVTIVCEAVAIGDFHKTVKVRSDKDRLSQSVNQMAANLHFVVDQVHKISKGDYSAEIVPKSSQDHLNQALSGMITILKEVKAENEQKTWLRSHRMELNDKMRGEQDVSVLGQNIIIYLTECLNAQIGAIYIRDFNSDEALYKLLGSYAFTKRKNLSNQFKDGEGLVGQAALEKQTIIITNVPDDYIKINSGLGEAVPGNIIVAPFLYENEVKGIVELGSFNEFTNIQLEFLNLISENIAIAINSAESRTVMEKLLQETQSQAEKLETQQEELKQTNEELTTQQEELRQTNEELEEQAKTLKESETNLQAQHEELQQINEELEERTNELEKQKDGIKKKNDELEISRNDLKRKAKDLELLSTYKSEFLANMSHELRTPLNSILILSKILTNNKDGNFTVKQTELANTINSAGTDLLNLINEILDLSKVESGKMQLHIEHLDLNDFAKNIKQKFKPVTDEKGLDFTIDIADGLPSSISTDRQRLDQIIKNLLSNSIKFTKKGSVILSIYRPLRDKHVLNGKLKPVQTIAISVTDTGIGIPENKQQLIFEAFQQADGTTSRKYGGTGLGLTISRELVKLLGGYVKLKSEEGKGSVFTIYLPEELKEGQTVNEKIDETENHVKDETENHVKQDNNASDLQPSTVKEKPETINVNEIPIDPDGELVWDDRRSLKSGDKSILIIEDDTKFARILYDLAHEKGFKCLVAENGETGLYLADYYKPSAIILDVGLPGIDGMSVMERLKNNAVTRHIPVHFISGTDKNLDAMRMGAIGYLTKPVSVEMLDEAFKRMDDLITKKVKKLLVVEDNESMRKSIVELIGNGDVTTTGISTGKEAYDLLKTGKFDCMVLDIGLSDVSGFDLLDKIRNNNSISYIPVIVYTGKDLSKEEEAVLKRYADSVIIKGARSPERLLDETALFLHRIESKLPEDKQKMLKMVYDKDAIFKDKTILLVDDDMRNVFALTHVIEEKGIKIIVGKNGKEGLACLDKTPNVDLVLMDIMMPEMDGYETTREIRKQNRFKNLPIIAITAKAMAGDKSKCITAGANDYLSKPIDTDKLISLLKVWLYKK